MDVETITEITYTDLENICRVCMSKDKLKLLNTLLYDNILLSDMYNNYTYLDLQENDNLPQNICVPCITNLIKVHNFIKKCKTTNDTLRELIKDHEMAVNGIKIEEDIDENVDENIDESVDENIDESVDENIDENVDENMEEVEEYVYVHVDDDHDYNIKNDEDMLKTRNVNLEDDREYIERKNIKENVKSRKKRKISLKNSLKKVFSCDVCDIDFLDHVKYQEHVKSHGNEQSFTCEYCKKHFKTRINIERHIVEHKIENGEIKIPNKLVCEICNEEFTNEFELIQHEDVHGKKFYQCEECDKKYFTSLAFESHQKTHEGFKPFTCTLCEKSFAQFALLKRHFFVHTRHKPFSCDICFKTFSQNAHLKTHFKTHTGERPYLCPYCNKAFALNGNLKVHVRTHTGEKPFLCDICGKGFYHSSTMKKHRITHAKHETI